MILKTLQVAGWRCFADPVTVGPFGEGLNILYAPNGTGKSTLFEALLRCVLDGHRVTGHEVEAIRPWGRLLSPTAIVEFFHEGSEFRITKRFLNDASSKLERKEDGRFVSLAEGQAADEAVRKILTRNPPGRGLARPENRGLAQVLWAPQGDLSVSKLSGDLVADIRSCLGVQAAGAATGSVEKQIEALYSLYFTTGGKLKAGRNAPLVVSLKENLQEARDRFRSALEQHQTIEEATRRVEDFRAAGAQARREVEALQEELRGARAQAESYRRLQSELEQHQERVKSAEAQYSELKQRCDAIEAAREELQKIQEQIDLLTQQEPLRRKEVEDRQGEVTRARAFLEDARQGRQAVDELRQQAEQAQRFVENWKNVEGLTKQIERIEKAEESLAQCKKERSDLVAPDAKTLRAIRKAFKELNEARVLIDASLITLEIVPTQDGSLEVISGEPAETQSLNSGHPIQIKGSPEVVVDLPPLGRLRATGPSGSIEEHRKKLTRAETKIRGYTEAFGSDDQEELEGLREQAKELDRKIAQAEAHLETLLSEQTTDEIEQERSKAESICSKILESHPEWGDSPPEVQGFTARADEARHSFREKEIGAEKEWEARQNALSAAREQCTKLSAQLEENQKQLVSLEPRLADLLSDGKQAEDRAQALRDFLLTRESAKARLEKTEKEVSSFGDDPQVVVDTLERQFKAASTAATGALEEEKREEGRIEQLVSGGPYSALALAEEEVSRLEKEIAHEELHVNAIGLLKDVVAQCRTDALAAVTGPVETVATRIVQRIAGTRLGHVKFGESFEPAHVAPELAETPVTLDCLSGGEREQVYLATRLALAEVLAKEERQLVVLDDVLTATDTGRLARIMNILEEEAQSLQILILTCHPERYRALEQASFFDLETTLRSN